MGSNRHRTGLNTSINHSRIPVVFILIQLRDCLIITTILISLSNLAPPKIHMIGILSIYPSSREKDIGNTTHTSSNRQNCLVSFISDRNNIKTISSLPLDLSANTGWTDKVYPLSLPVTAASRRWCILCPAGAIVVISRSIRVGIVVTPVPTRIISPRGLSNLSF